MPKAFAVPATGVVEYQYAELLHYTGEERWVEAIEIRPSARSVVHHADVFMASSELGTVALGPGERWAAYVPREMIVLPKGTVLHGIAHFDNSAGNPTNPDPTQSVQWGQQTFEEMMFGFVELIYDEDASSPALQALRTADHRDRSAALAPRPS